MTDGLFEDVRHMKGAANYCLPSIAVGALDNAAPAPPQPDATGGAGAAVTAEPAVGTSRPSDGESQTWGDVWTCGHLARDARGTGLAERGGPVPCL